jgi:hypothetical protein
MAENHELFDLVALYILKRAYDTFPVPSDILHTEIMDAIRPEGSRALSISIAYTPGFLERNGYIHRYGSVGSSAHDTSSKGLRISLNDKGLVALKMPSPAEPKNTVYERIRTAFITGAEMVPADTAASLIRDVFQPRP